MMTRLLNCLALLAFCAPVFAGSVRVHADSEARSLPLVGFNSNAMNSPLDLDAYRERVVTLAPQLLRYPGGTVGDHFDWRAGWLDIETLPAELSWWADVPERPLRPGDMSGVLRQVASEPVLAVNAFSSTAEEQAGMLRRFRDLLGVVPFVELGNEYYFDFPRYLQRYAEPADYAREMNDWLPVLRQAAPEAEFCVIAASPHSASASQRQRDWNEAVFGIVDGVDAACFHPYFGTLTRSELESPDGMARLFSIPFRRWERFRDTELAALPTGWQAWITEYNLFAPDDPGVRDTWLHGLLHALYTMLLMEDERITMLLSHQLAGNPSFAAIRTRFPLDDPQPFELSASGHGIAMMFEALSRRSTGVRLHFEAGPEITVVSPEGTAIYPALVGWELDGQALLVVHLGESPTSLDLSEVARCPANDRRQTDRRRDERFRGPASVRGIDPGERSPVAPPGGWVVTTLASVDALESGLSPRRSADVVESSRITVEPLSLVHVERNCSDLPERP
ncbi:MAG: hypothetical protein R3323_03530 [Wenzhouxiangellaceae bacterium]|nr:hypothetical protein [Wenzhouxiangellaceae bacterium]